ncbi:MAG: DUF86 domain-containing protein [Acidobacteriota bacterium]
MSIEKRWRFGIEHILEPIEKIQRYTEGMNEETFAANSMALGAVIRNFLVIGEATRQIPAEIRAKHQSIPWPLMQGMCNVLVHEYDAVKLEVVWRTSPAAAGR